MQIGEKIHSNIMQTQMDAQIINSTNCWFCDKPAADGASAEIYLQKLLNTNIGLTGNKYEYLVLSRQIPCCRICSQTHENARKWSSALTTFGGIAGFLAGLILPFVIVLNFRISPGKDFKAIVLFAILVGVVSGVILGYLLGNKIAFILAPGTKPQTYAKQHPLIKPLIEQGWRFGKPE